MGGDPGPGWGDAAPTLGCSRRRLSGAPAGGGGMAARLGFRWTLDGPTPRASVHQGRGRPPRSTSSIDATGRRPCLGPAPQNRPRSPPCCSPYSNSITTMTDDHSHVLDTTEVKAYLRPRFHLTAPYGCMTSLCAPGYDPSTYTYHLFYQCEPATCYPLPGRVLTTPGNPKACEPGNSWGHSTSTDLVNWTRASLSPALEPNQSYDKESVCIGYLHPAGPHGEEGQLTVIYSSAQSLSAAVSNDHGKTLSKLPQIPVLSGAPQGFEVTGWRSPYVGRWPCLDHIRGKNEKRSLYGLVSGGIPSDGPAAFLYEVDPEDLTKWTYLSPLITFSKGHCPSDKWAGNFGINWENANFMTLQCPRAKDYTRDFVILGTEESAERPQSSLWLSGTLTRELETGIVDLDYDFSGILDHGSFHAANSFMDLRNRRVLYGWVPEDATAAPSSAKDWSGCLALPRELFLVFIPGVIKALKTPLEDLESFGLEDEKDGMTGVRTLGIRPLPELAQLRIEESIPLLDVVLPTASGETDEKVDVTGVHWELEAEIDVRPGCKRAGFLIRHTPDLAVRTIIYFSPETEEIIVDRGDAKLDVRGPHTLFTLRRDQEELLELLHLRIFCDRDVLEVFANDRFALSTRVPITYEEAAGISAFAEGEKESAVFESVKVWEMANIGHELLA